ncbi:MAG: glycosyltransferase, partial [Lachnospiraceae bacterium]|nr:glycosyltransferase [Lachnospiraceae bacterium]
MSIIESISVKTPVICSDIGNPAALVTEGKSGLKFRCGDAKDLAQKVEMMEQAPFEADESCAAEFSAEKNYEKLMEIYESSIKRCNSKKRSTH